MRRRLRCLLVGILVFSLSFDTARACWFLRHARRPRAVAACPPTRRCGSGCWTGTIVVAAADIPCPSTADACAGRIVRVVPQVEEIACGPALDCCGREIVITESVAPEAAAVVAPAATTGIVTPPSPTAAREAPTPAAEPAEPVQPATALLPDLQPVVAEPPVDAAARADEQQTAAPEASQPAPVTREEMRETPAAEPAAEPRPETPAFSPETPAFSPETPAPSPETPAPSPETPAPSPETPAAAEPTPTATPAAEEPAEEMEAEPAAPEPEAAPEEPAETNLFDDAAPPASQPNTDEQARAAAEGVQQEPSSEPARRWIDVSGRYATVGTLVTVLDGKAMIRKADGRTVRVPLDRLSLHDRDYATAAGFRLLAGPSAPQPTDTAGL